jgi:hypothetical protein
MDNSKAVLNHNRHEFSCRESTLKPCCYTTCLNGAQQITLGMRDNRIKFAVGGLSAIQMKTDQNGLDINLENLEISDMAFSGVLVLHLSGHGT